MKYEKKYDTCFYYYKVIFFFKIIACNRLLYKFERQSYVYKLLNLENRSIFCTCKQCQF